MKKNEIKIDKEEKRNLCFLFLINIIFIKAIVDYLLEQILNNIYWYNIKILIPSLFLLILMFGIIMLIIEFIKITKKPKKNGN